MPAYEKLSSELQERIIEDRNNNWKNPYAFSDDCAIRRNMSWDKQNLWRPAFIRDIDKILNIPYYNRYGDKTQVFSFMKNDDITRRSIHVQYVSRIARNIGRMLGLNQDLIEAIALGHDIGHTPFGHAGERMLNEIYHENTGRYFNHNVHSVRVLDQISRRNICLQTLDGILCHNGEIEQQEYRPCTLTSFDEFDKKVEGCYIDEQNIGRLVPSTLEGCVVRISDIIAYIGKDRQDAIRLGIISDKNDFSKCKIGNLNSQMINNLIVNIIENSYGKDYISMSEEHFAALKEIKKENYSVIYGNSDINKEYMTKIAPMMRKMYEVFLSDLESENYDSLIYKHHINYIKDTYIKYCDTPDYKYEENEKNQIVVDFIASMTDDYFIDAYKYMFKDEKVSIEFSGYFEEN